MNALAPLIFTALAPMIWGSTYYITSEFLPDGYPLTMAAFRALPAGLLLLLCVRQLPKGIWVLRTFVLGALNFSLFWAMLFVAAYHLPGGVAATLGAVQIFIVILLSSLILKSPVHPLSIFAAVIGVGGVFLLVYEPGGSLSTTGILAGLCGAGSMAAGTVLSKKWQPPVSTLTFTAWQLTAGGILLLPLAFLVEPPLPELPHHTLGGILYLTIIGGAVSYFIWFRGLRSIAPNVMSSLGFVSPLTAVLIGWMALGQAMNLHQMVGAFCILTSAWCSQRAQTAPVPQTR